MLVNNYKLNIPHDFTEKRLSVRNEETAKKVNTRKCELISAEMERKNIIFHLIPTTAKVLSIISVLNVQVSK